jgi:hypothetical protein
MTSVQHVPQAPRCSTCSSHAGAATIRGDHAHCCTFVEISIRAGNDHTRLVGACHRSDCRFDDMLECPASAMHVDAPASPDTVDCLTPEPK